ncbi:hypothetical protein T12_253 [Trichinella patagoniensis]|uniref:Uncharacterized protein n=1 Tax=Trichinella patagoniensis TaxID=990121 RepID=A0A0V0ZZZ9_9BILA|nr:hypothetical protein T12_253 [Trichinella patagoniensis]
MLNVELACRRSKTLMTCRRTFLGCLLGNIGDNKRNNKRRRRTWPSSNQLAVQTAFHLCWTQDLHPVEKIAQITLTGAQPMVAPWST